MVAENQNDDVMKGFNTLKAWLKTKENLPQGVGKQYEFFL